MSQKKTCHFHDHVSLSRPHVMFTGARKLFLERRADVHLKCPRPHVNWPRHTPPTHASSLRQKQKAANQATHPICSTSLMNWRQMDLVSDDLASSSTNSLPTSKKKTLKPTSQHARPRFPRQAISAPRDITRTETPQGTRAGAPHIPSQQARSRFPRKRSLRRVTSHEVKLRKAHALRHHEPKPTRPL